MADNDRFVIRKIFKGFQTTDKLISEKDRSEYEAIVLETINYECSSVLNEIKSVNTRELAKAVVDKLFGEGE